MKKNILIETAAKHGWDCQWKPEGQLLYRLSATTQDGISWQMESSSSHRYTKWKTDSVRLAEYQYVSFSQRKPPNRYSLSYLFSSIFIKPAFQKALNEALAHAGPDEDDEEPGLMYDLDLQTLLFKENHYNLFVNDLEQSFVRRVFDSEVEQAILSWFTGPGRNRFNPTVLDNISISEDDVKVDSQNSFHDVSYLEQLVALGLLVARKARKAQC